MICWSRTKKLSNKKAEGGDLLMIYVDAERCNGCGACTDVCATGALSLQEDKAFIDANLCSECEDCLDICPQEAILSVEAVEVPASRQVEQPTPAVITVAETAPQPATPSPRTLIWPAIGSALVWTGRELVPRLASLAVEWLDQRQSPGNRSLSRRANGQQQRRRQRRRRGR
jgi:ferredoxin